MPDRSSTLTGIVRPDVDRRALERNVEEPMSQALDRVSRITPDLDLRGVGRRLSRAVPGGGLLRGGAGRVTSGRVGSRMSRGGGDVQVQQLMKLDDIHDAIRKGNVSGGMGTGGMFGIARLGGPFSLLAALILAGGVAASQTDISGDAEDPPGPGVPGTMDPPTTPETVHGPRFPGVPRGLVPDPSGTTRPVPDQAPRGGDETSVDLPELPDFSELEDLQLPELPEWLTGGANHGPRFPDVPEGLVADPAGRPGGSASAGPTNVDVSNQFDINIENQVDEFKRELNQEIERAIANAEDDIVDAAVDVIRSQLSGGLGGLGR